MIIAKEARELRDRKRLAELTKILQDTETTLFSAVNFAARCGKSSVVATYLPARIHGEILEYLRMLGFDAKPLPQNVNPEVDDYFKVIINW